MSNETNDGGAVRAGGFPLRVAIIALIAALAVALVDRFALPAWMLYMGWISYAVAGSKPRPGFAMFACVMLGIALGIVGMLTLRATTGAFGGLALPAMVFGVTAIAVLTQKLPVISYVVGYFIGMTGYFASGLEPGVPAFLALAAAGAVGAVSGWLATELPARLATARAPA